MTQHFDMIIVGTGFSASFFLLGYLEKAKPNARILVLERGRRDPHYWQTQNRKTSSIDHLTTFVNRNPRKDWVYSPGFGGGSNCWWGVTPRFLPNDFQAQSVYNIGVDWPMSYDDLEPFYYQAETDHVHLRRRMGLIHFRVKIHTRSPLMSLPNLISCSKRPIPTTSFTNRLPVPE